MTGASSQRGSALIFVGIVGLVVSMMLGLFLNSTVLVEERAVETELARSRAYWAQMGALNYALSRISYSQLCDAILCLGNYKDSELAPVLSAYLYELNNNRSWTYADEAAGYSFTLAATASPDDMPGRQNYSGWLMATTSTSAASLLASSAGTLPRLELRVCVGRPSGASCGFLSVNNGGNTTKYFSINRLTTL